MKHLQIAHTWRTHPRPLLSAHRRRRRRRRPDTTRKPCMASPRRAQRPRYERMLYALIADPAQTPLELQLHGPACRKVWTSPLSLCNTYGLEKGTLRAAGAT